MTSESALDKFMSVYEQQLRLAVEKYPEDYLWLQDAKIVGNVSTTIVRKLTVEQVAEKMREAFRNDSYDSDGRAIRWTCKILDVRHTRSGINRFLRGNGND